MKYGKAIASVAAMREITEEADAIAEQAVADTAEILTEAERLKAENERLRAELRTAKAIGGNRHE